MPENARRMGTNSIIVSPFALWVETSMLTPIKPNEIAITKLKRQAPNHTLLAVIFIFAPTFSSKTIDCNFLAVEYYKIMSWRADVNVYYCFH